MKDLNEALEKVWGDVFPGLDVRYGVGDRVAFGMGDGSARQALWRCGDGWIVGYTTERITGGQYHGRFATMAYKPIGRGARSGDADEHKRVYFRGFSTRRAARARAERLYDLHRGRKPV